MLGDVRRNEMIDLVVFIAFVLCGYGKVTVCVGSRGVEIVRDLL